MSAVLNRQFLYLGKNFTIIIGGMGETRDPINVTSVGMVDLCFQTPSLIAAILLTF